MIVSAKNVHFSYGEVEVLRDVSVDIAPGEVVALLGPNGAGKTTLIELILGFLKPNSGELNVLGIDPQIGKADFWEEIGVLQQQWRDHPKWRVREQLEWIASAHKSVGKHVKTPEEVLAEVGLSDFMNHQLGKLSGGQRRRVDFAAATIASPKLLILDEPTTGLDPVARNDIHMLIDAAQDRDASVLMSTHDLAEAEKIASRIMILSNHRIVANGTATQLREGIDKRAEVTWRDASGKRHVHATDQAEKFVRTLPEDISELTVTRHTLEDAYLNIIGESGKPRSQAEKGA